MQKAQNTDLRDVRSDHGGFVRFDRGEAFSLDPQAGGTANNKPIWNLDQIEANLNRTGWDWYTNNYGELDDGVLNFGFFATPEDLYPDYVNDQFTLAFSEYFYFTPFNPAQIAAATNSIGLWDDLVDIRFQKTAPGEGDINFGNTWTGGAQAYAYLPFGDIFDASQGGGFSEVGRLSGDVWVDGFVASNFFPIKDSYYSVTTLIHEIGHAIGLSHPGDYDALDDDDGDGEPDPITYGNDAKFAQDSLQYTIMSYFDALETGAQHVDWTLMNFAYAATPLVHDIAAIQAIYGADMTTRTGDTVYGFNSTADRSAYDFSLNTRPIVSIWDAGGNDTLDFSGWNTPSVIDLNAGAFSSGGGIEQLLTLEQINANRAALGFAPRTAADYAFYLANFVPAGGITNGLFKDNISIAYGATIENAVGGGGDDLIISNPVANKIDGGAGFDTLSYRSATSGVNVTVGNNFSGSAADGDKFTSIEKIEGSNFGDQLKGGNSADTLFGLGGNDEIKGGNSRDTLDGGAGNDLLDGGNDSDVLAGGAGDDTLDGGNGNDTLNGGAGNDRLEGGNGKDTYAFTDAGTDTIVGYQRGEKIDFSNLLESDGTGVDQADVTIASNGRTIFVDLDGNFDTKELTINVQGSTVRMEDIFDPGAAGGSASAMQTEYLVVA